MAAITEDRDTREKGLPAVRFQFHHFTPTASIQFYKGGMVAIDPATGLLIKAVADVAAHIVIGRCEENILTAASGAARVKVSTGIFAWATADVDALDRGKAVYVTDDQTVTITAGDEAKAGTVYDFDAATSEVWVTMPWPAAS